MDWDEANLRRRVKISEFKASAAYVYTREMDDTGKA